jgi:hypothetical protein
MKLLADLRYLAGLVTGLGLGVACGYYLGFGTSVGVAPQVMLVGCVAIVGILIPTTAMTWRVVLNGWVPRTRLQSPPRDIQQPQARVSRDPDGGPRS